MSELSGYLMNLLYIFLVALYQVLSNIHVQDDMTEEDEDSPTISMLRLALSNFFMLGLIWILYTEESHHISTKCTARDVSQVGAYKGAYFACAQVHEQNK
jgi:hypothetical protein